MTALPPISPQRDGPDVRLLLALRTASVHLSADELASSAAIPSGSVESRLDIIRAAGFEIELKPGYGYRLRKSPDRIIADDLWARLQSTGHSSLLREILAFEETGSTNDMASQFGRQGREGGLAVFAERQTAGRGRFGRRWESPSHRGLWFSILLRPALPVAHWTRLTTWAAVSVAAALEKTGGCRAGIKWPNDIFLDGRKAAGILIEMGTGPDQQPFAVVGIGVNINHEPSDFPRELRATATSLRQAAGHEIERPAAAAAILRELDSHYPQVTSDFAAIVATAAERSTLLGHWVKAQADQKAIEGMAEELDAAGHLLVRTADGTLEKLSAGEVTLQTVSS